MEDVTAGRVALVASLSPSDPKGGLTSRAPTHPQGDLSLIPALLGVSSPCQPHSHWSESPHTGRNWDLPRVSGTKIKPRAPQVLGSLVTRTWPGLLGPRSVALVGRDRAQPHHGLAPGLESSPREPGMEGDHPLRKTLLRCPGAPGTSDQLMVTGTRPWGAYGQERRESNPPLVSSYRWGN